MCYPTLTHMHGLRLGGMAESEIQVGAVGVASVVCEESRTAAAVGSGTVPVFATPELVCVMEAACCKAIEGKLAEGKTSVGTKMSVEHKSATRVGLTVTATATVTDVQKGGRLLLFSVEASDGIDVVGTCECERFVVDSSKFLARAMAKGTSD
eukprot:m.11462 g.11462  ORF g.11462 m.11462 type:complete len:153 (-) comp5729_c0_seq1:261-719(-)